MDVGQDTTAGAKLSQNSGIYKSHYAPSRIPVISGMKLLEDWVKGELTSFPVKIE